VTTKIRELALEKRDTVNKAYLTSVTLDSVKVLFVYLPRPWVNFKDLYNLLNRAVQYLLQCQDKEYIYYQSIEFERNTA